MLGDEGYVEQEYHQLLEFIVRHCETDAKVYREHHIIHEYSTDNYINRINSLRVKVAHLLAIEYDTPLYITEAITNIPAEQ